jgi:2,4-dienoyl-CoA reductase-like NADH-dependent reductase (Old Yellow Enzyme family)
LYTTEHAVEWKKVVDAVHARGGVIFFQLWHTGRQSHPSFHPNNEVLSASAVLPTGSATTRDAEGNSAPFVAPREITIPEIACVIQDFKRSAQFAKEAGFDGVEVSGGGGYLVDTFLQSCSNKRTDIYGGPKENRFRFLREITEALIEVFPANRVAIKITSNGNYGGMGSVDNAEAFIYYAQQLSKYGLAYLHIMDGPGFGFHTLDRQLTLYDFKKAFDGPVLGVVGFTKDVAEGVIRSGAADLIAFGRPYISNPDLVERFQNNWPQAPDPPYEHWWTNSLGAVGYTDYPNYQV